jgi:hypothetical protein
VFDHGQKGAADQMRTTWENTVHHVGTVCDHDISNELHNKKTVIIQKPKHAQEALDEHAERETRHNNQERCLANAREDQETAPQAAVTAAADPEAPMLLALLENQIKEAAHQATVNLPIKLDKTKQTEHDIAWCACRKRNTRLETQRGQAFSVIRGQCMQVLLDEMKHDANWTTASESYDPLTLLRLIERTILAQTEDQHPCATVCEQESTLCSFSQNTLINEQWHKRFNTKIDVGSAIGVTRQHQILLKHVAAETGTVKFEDLSKDDQEEVSTTAEERCLSHVFLRQSGKQHDKLKVDLQNNFTTGDNRHPKNRQSTLHLLDKHSKSTIVNTTLTSEGTAFAQRSDKDNKILSKKDKEF